MNVVPTDAALSLSQGRVPARFGAGLVVDGDLVSGEDLILDGKLTGGLHAPDHVVTIGPTGVVRGRIFARIVVLEGTVHGEVTATNVIEVNDTAKVEADLNAPAVAIAQGAYVVGKIDMRRAEAAARVARYRIERGLEGRREERGREERARDERITRPTTAQP